MKYPVRVMSLVLSQTAAMAPPSSAQTQPANPPTATQAQQQKEAQQKKEAQKRKEAEQQNSHSKAKVRQRVPQSEPLRETLPPARSSELATPVVKRAGTAGKQLRTRALDIKGERFRKGVRAW